MFGEMSVEKFLAETASKNPVPGGGSIAALSAGLSASLIEMVAGLTIGKKGFEEVEAEMKNLSEIAGKHRVEFLQFIDKDSEAFNNVMGAFKLPKETDAEKKSRSAIIQDSFKSAALVPLEIAKNAFELMSLAQVVVSKGNQNAVTDGAVATMMARTAVLSALYNVKINLGSIKDEAFVTDVTKQVEELETKVNVVEKSILDTVKL